MAKRSVIKLKNTMCSGDVDFLLNVSNHGWDFTVNVLRIAHSCVICCGEPLPERPPFKPTSKLVEDWHNLQN